MEWSNFIGKKIYVRLVFERFYTGIVKEVTFMGKDENNVDIFLIGITDKFGKFVAFSSKEIKLIKEEP